MKTCFHETLQIMFDLDFHQNHFLELKTGSELNEFVNK